MYKGIKKEWMLSIGMFSLTVAILLDRLGLMFPGKDFMVGLFTGLSLALNLGYLIRFSSEKHQHLSNLTTNQNQN